MKENRPQTSPNLPGATTKVGTAPIAPRPRSPSLTDEVTLPGNKEVTGVTAVTAITSVAAKTALTPRAPAVSRPDPGEAAPDPRALALAAAKEITAPFETKIADLEKRLAQLEGLARRAGSMPDIPKAMIIGAPAPATAAAILAANTPAALASPAAIPIPPPPAALLAADTVETAAVSLAPISLPPVSMPAPVIVRMRAPMSSSPIHDAPLSKAEYSMFDGSKRQRRVAWMFVLVLLLLGGALAVAFATSQT